MFFCYARVSTDEQDARSQMAGIREMLAKKGIGPDDPLKVKWISDEGVSGVVEWRRRGLGKALRAAKRGDTIVASEISRLARSLGQLFDFVGACHDKGVTVETVKDGWRLDGTMQSKMVMVFMGLAAEMERDLLVQRTREGLARARRDGVKLGRPKGSKKNTRSWRALMERFFGCSPKVGAPGGLPKSFMCIPRLCGCTSETTV